MKFLVLGCNGMAGHMVALYLKTRAHEVIGFARQKSSYIDTIIGDATNINLLCQVIQDGKYDTIVNCIGVLNQFAEFDHANAIFLNSYLPHYLSKITENTKSQIIHISTDCVFSGAKGGYTEKSFPDGITFYDRTKALGELNDNKNVTLRTSIVGPDMKDSGIGLLNWFMQQRNTIYGYAGAIWTGQTTLQLAKTVEAAAIVRAHGLYNAVPNETISKYDLLQLFNQYIRKVPIQIIKKDDFISDKTLIRTNWDGFNYQIPGYREMIKELGIWMKEHKSMYPQYDL